MTTRISILLLLCTLPLSVCCSKSSTDSGEVLTIEDLLVENNEITGWTYAGERWVAQSISELTVYINGAAEIYQRHGFQEAAYQAYEGTIDAGTRTLELTVFDQGSSSNAKDTFDDPDTGFSGATPWAGGAGDEAHYKRYGLSQAMAFRRGRYFVLLGMTYDTEESLNVLKQFALNVDGKIE